MLKHVNTTRKQDVRCLLCYFRKKKKIKFPLTCFLFYDSWMLSRGCCVFNDVRWSRTPPTRCLILVSAAQALAAGPLVKWGGSTRACERMPVTSRTGDLVPSSQIRHIHVSMTPLPPAPRQFSCLRAQKDCTKAPKLGWLVHIWLTQRSGECQMQSGRGQTVGGPLWKKTGLCFWAAANN